MVKRLCDKCGKEIYRNPYSQIVYPYYEITVHYALFNSSNFDLCDDCQKKLLDWFQSKEDCINE